VRSSSEHCQKKDIQCWWVGRAADSQEDLMIADSDLAAETLNEVHYPRPIATQAGFTFGARQTTFVEKRATAQHWGTLWR
jgi:hypothetical protein